MKGLKLNKAFVQNLIIVLLCSYILNLKHKDEEKIVVPEQSNEIFIDSPVEVFKYDTIYRDSIKRFEVERIVRIENPVNKELLSKYEEARKQNDSLKQLQLYKEAIIERSYNQIFEDSVQIITVESFVTGKLNGQRIKYNIKPKLINIKSVPEKPLLYAGLFAYGLKEVVVGANLNLLNNEKNKIFTIGFDAKKSVHFGVSFKIL